MTKQISGAVPFDPTNPQPQAVVSHMEEVKPIDPVSIRFGNVKIGEAFFDHESGEFWTKISDSTGAMQSGGGQGTDDDVDEFSSEDLVTVNRETGKLRFLGFGQAPEAAKLGYSIQELAHGTEIEIIQRFAGDLIAVKGAALQNHEGSHEWAIMAKSTGSPTRELESKQSEDWPHDATVKLMFVHGSGASGETGWAKRDEYGRLVSTYSLLPLDPSQWDVVEERNLEEVGQEIMSRHDLADQTIHDRAAMLEAKRFWVFKQSVDGLQEKWGHIRNLSHEECADLTRFPSGTHLCVDTKKPFFWTYALMPFDNMPSSAQ